MLKRLSKSSLPVAVTALGVLAIAGCGTPSSNTTGGSGGANTANSTTGASGSNQNDMLAQIQKSGQLTIAESAYAPEDFQDPKTKQWSGYDVDILKGFAQSLGVKLHIDAMSFSSSITAVADKRDDLTIDIYYSAKRAKVLSFSRPMLNYNDAIAVNSKNPQVAAPTLADLKGKTVAVVSGSAEVSEAKAIPGAKVKTYNTISESFLALSTGRVAADLQPDTDISWSKKQNPSLNIKLLGPVPKSIAPPIQSLRGYYGVPKGQYSARFLTKLNAYLKKIASDGTEQTILNKYGMKSSVFLQGISSAPDTYSGS